MIVIGSIMLDIVQIDNLHLHNPCLFFYCTILPLPLLKAEFKTTVRNLPLEIYEDPAEGSIQVN